MSNFLTDVKPSVSGLRQISCPATHGPCTVGNQSVSNMPDEKPYADIAERIAWHRALTGLDQADYAERAGLKRTQLSNWESGNTRLSLDGALALRRTYGLPLDFMYEGIAETLDMTLRSAWMDRPSVKRSR